MPIGEWHGSELFVILLGALTPPPVDPKKQLVDKLRKLQLAENGRVLWWSFCKVHAGGKLEPEAHDTAFLMTFFECFEKGDIMEEPGCPPSVRNPAQATAAKGVSKGSTPKGKGSMMSHGFKGGCGWGMPSMGACKGGLKGGKDPWGGYGAMGAAWPMQWW